MTEEFYVSTYCNFAHNMNDGKPIDHECVNIPPAALEAEMAGDFDRAIRIMKRQFDRFKTAVARQWEKMQRSQLFRTEVEKDLMWMAYIESFPEGSNPIYKERTEHDCQSCKSFIRAVGSMVAVVDGELTCLWDCEVGEPYTQVAAALSELVKAAPIKNILLHDQRSAGVDQNHQDDDGTILTWEHFHIALPDACVKASDRGTAYSEAQSTKDVFARALEEITLDAIEMVTELIDQGSLYRGEEHLNSVKAFARQKKLYDKLESERGKELFAWQQLYLPSVTRIRSTAIGTLLVDLSEGKTLDDAVRMFESKVAPADPDAKRLFKWDNGFSWCYNGELADSIKQRVKSAGGDVTGDFRASLAWYNYDDLDIHLTGPGPHGGRQGMHVFFSNRRDPSTGCELDVDMNAGSGTTRNAVENITFPQRSKMREGEYELKVHQYCQREHDHVGFEIEMEFDGNISTFSYDQEIRQYQYVSVAKFRFTQKDGIEFLETLPRQNVSKELWGLTTQQFIPVQMIMLSPNHWNGRPTGNKHFMFMLQGCEREGSSRGFFNEYLNESLRDHRKVFERLGSKMRTQDEGPQLSGLGFSSTRRNSVYARVSGAFTRTVKITF